MRLYARNTSSLRSLYYGTFMFIWSSTIHVSILRLEMLYKHARIWVAVAYPTASISSARAAAASYSSSSLPEEYVFEIFPIQQQPSDNGTERKLHK